MSQKKIKRKNYTFQQWLKNQKETMKFIHLFTKEEQIEMYHKEKKRGSSKIY